jgi:hypothetical protein
MSRVLRWIAAGMISVLVDVTATVTGVEPNPPHSGDLSVMAPDATGVALHVGSGRAVISTPTVTASPTRRSRRPGTHCTD